MMCRIAQNDGTMRYGLRATSSRAMRIQRGHHPPGRRRLVEHGYIERVRIGGGRLSTHWRIVVDKLAPADAKPPEPPQPPERVNAPEKPQRRRPHWPRPSFSRPSSPAVTTICAEHGGDGGTLSDGTPRCPQCRRRPGSSLERIARSAGPSTGRQKSPESLMFSITACCAAQLRMCSHRTRQHQRPSKHWVF